MDQTWHLDSSAQGACPDCGTSGNLRTFLRFRFQTLENEERTISQESMTQGLPGNNTSWAPQVTPAVAIGLPNPHHQVQPPQPCLCILLAQGIRLLWCQSVSGGGHGGQVGCSPGFYMSSHGWGFSQHFQVMIDAALVKQIRLETRRVNKCVIHEFANCSSF